MTPHPRFLVSGWAHDSQSLAPLAQALDATPLDLFDLDPPADTSTPLSPYAANLLRRLESSPQPAVLIGWSMGGMVCLELALHRPTRVRALALIASTPRFRAAPDFPSGIAERQLLGLSRLLQRNPETALRRFYADAWHPAAPPQPDTDQLIERILSRPPIALLRHLEYLQHSDWRSGVSSLHLPLLAIHGSADRVIPTGASEWLCARAPRVRLHIADSAGHTLPMQAPCQVADWIDSFVESSSDRYNP